MNTQVPTLFALSILQATEVKPHPVAQSILRKTDTQGINISNYKLFLRPNLTFDLSKGSINRMNLNTRNEGFEYYRIKSKYRIKNKESKCFCYHEKMMAEKFIGKNEKDNIHYCLLIIFMLQLCALL